MADLARRLDLPVKLDFVRLASYGDKTQTCGNVRITKDVELPLQGSHVLVVEDIVDSGITLKWLLDHLSNLCPESVKICALIDKLERREVEVPVDYVGNNGGQRFSGRLWTGFFRESQKPARHL